MFKKRSPQGFLKNYARATPSEVAYCKIVLCILIKDLLNYFLPEFFFDQDSMNEILEMFHKTLADGDVALSTLISVVEVVEKFVQCTNTLSTRVCS